MSALSNGIAAVQEQAGGMVDLFVIQPSYVPDLLGAALAGDRLAASMLRAIADTRHKIDKAPRRLPALCASCPRPLLKSTKYTVVMAAPQCDNPTAAIGLAVCAHCATEPDAVAWKAAAALKKIWPDSRAVRVTHPEGGRA